MSTNKLNRNSNKIMDQYIQQLLRDQGVEDNLEPAVRDQLVSELSSRATDFMNRRLIDSLSDDAAEQFDSLINEEGTSPEQIQEFITNNVPDRDKIVAGALYEFRTLYLGDKA